MSYYDGGDTGSSYVPPNVRFGGASRAKSYEEKSAKKFIDIIGTLTFDVSLFAVVLASFGEEAEKRVMAVVKAIIRAYADKWDVGYHTESTRDAKRLADTLTNFDM